MNLLVFNETSLLCLSMSKKIVLLAPVYPWRWGIAHHTNRLVNELSRQWYDVSIVSFSQQYPTWLYPGKSQKEASWTLNPLSIRPSYILNPLNPITWLRTVRTLQQLQADVVIFRYWHIFFVPCMTVILWLLWKKWRTLRLCIIDNLYPHERKMGDTIWVKIVLSQTDQAITQSSITHQQYQDIVMKNKPPEIMIEHPVYDEFGPKVSMGEARKILGLSQDKTILLFFGFIRPYKWLDILLEAMPEIIQDQPDVHLLIVGEPFWSFQSYQDIIHQHRIESYITTILTYIPSEQIPIYFWVADLLVMPYRSMTNSGIENIGKIYACRSLLTLGYKSADLANAILSRLRQPQEQLSAAMSWNTYVSQLWRFIKDL